MSRVVDEYVSSMDFDNRRFERNVQTSMVTLDKLKQNLNMPGATRGLENVATAAKGVDMSGISNAVQTVTAKFSVMQVAAVTAIANIVNQAVNAGKRITKALTIDPITTGFNEYETKIGSIQTIMSNTASKGTTMQDVTRVIDELNRYADKTIYNFAEMTRNIGTFTAAGVGLEESAAAIQGIANLAAASGSTSQQASTAMYQLSQALASGTVKLMDWNSVVNAGMGGEKFQNALKETSKRMAENAKSLKKMSKAQRKAYQETHGYTDDQMKSMMAYSYNVDKLVEKNGSFRESLQAGWITADVLNETLKNFTVDGATEYANSMVKLGKWTKEQAEAHIKEAESMEDAATKVKTLTQLWDTLKESAQSGWGQTWEIIVGDFNEAKDLWTEMSDTIGGMINGMSESRNNLAKGAFMSGWKQFLSLGIEDGEGYKDALKSVVSEHGKSMDEMIKKAGSFEGALSKGLRDGEITWAMVTEAVTKLADKTRKMSDAEREAAGYTEDCLTNLESMEKALKDGTISMGEFVQKLSRPSGRELVIDSLRNAFKGLMSVFAPIKEAFREIFPPMTSERLYEILEKIHALTEKFTLSGDQAGKLKSIFKGLFSVISLGWTFTKELTRGVRDLLGSFKGLGNFVIDNAAKFGEWLNRLRETEKETNAIGNAVDKVVDFLQNAIDKFKEFCGWLKVKVVLPGWEGFVTVMSSIWDYMKKIGSKVSELKVDEALQKALNKFKELASQFKVKVKVPGWDNLRNIMASTWAFMKKITGALLKAGAELGKAFATVFRSGDIKAGLDVLNGGIFMTILLGLKRFVNGLSSIGDGAKGFMGSLTDMLDGVKGCLSAWQTSLKADALKKIAVAIAILAASLLVLAMIDPTKLNTALSGITMLFADLAGSMLLLDKFGGTGKDSGKAMKGMIKMAIAVLILASALKKVASIPAENLAAGVIGILALTAIIVAAAKLMSRDGKKVAKGAGKMIIMAVALKILASVCEDLSKLTWEELGKGVAGIGILLAEFVGFQALMKKINPKKILSSAVSMFIMGAAMAIFANVAAKFGGMEWEALAKAGAAISGILLLAAGFSLISKFGGKMGRSSVALFIISIAMEIFANVCQKFSQLEWEELGKAASAIGGILALAIGFGVLARFTKGILKGSMALISIGIAMEIFANVASKFGGMGWESLAKAGAAIGGIMALAVGFAALAKLSGGMLGSSFALIAVAVALKMLVPVLKELGSMRPAQLIQGLIAIAAAFAVIGIAAKFLKPVIPAMLKLAGVFLVLGVACLAVGVGLGLIAAGFTALALSLSGGVTAIVAALGVIINGILELIPTIVEKLGAAIVALCQVIIAVAPALGEAIVAVVLAIVQVLIECVPEIVEMLVTCVPLLVEGLFKIITAALQALAAYTPGIVASIFDFLIGLLNSISEKLPDLIQAGVDLLMSFLQGVVDAVKGMDTEVLIEGLVAIGYLSALMLVLATVAGLVPGAMAGVLGMGAVVAELAIVLAAIGALAQVPGLDWLISEGGDFMQLIGSAIGQFVGGIVGGVAEGFTSSLPEIGTNLSSFMTNLEPFIAGAKTIDTSILDSIQTLVGIILALTAANLLDSLTSWLTGGASFAEFGKQLVPFGRAMKGFSDEVSGIDESAIESASKAGKTLAEMAKSLPNSGGVAGFFAGNNDMGDFAAQLVDFGKAIMGFSEEVTGIDTEAIDRASKAGIKIAEMADALPNSGGAAGFFAGNNDMGTFATQLVPFGKAIAGFAAEVEGIDTEGVEAAASAGKKIAEMAKSLPNSGGVAGFFAGNNDMSDFSLQLVDFAKAIRDFSKIGTFVDLNGVDLATEAGKKMAAMADVLPNSGGVVGFFVGNNDMSQFSTQLVDFAKAIRDFSKIGAFVDMDGMNLATEAGKKMAEMADILPNSGGVAGFFAGNNDMGLFSEDLVAFGKSVRDFSKIGAFIDIKGLSSTIAAVNKLMALLDDLDSISSDGVTKFKDALAELGTSSVDGFVEVFSNSGPAVHTAALNMLRAFTMGMYQGRPLVLRSVMEVASAAVSTILMQQGRFISAGRYLVQGLANGINAYTSLAVNSAAMMARAAIKAANNALGINSPSKEFYASGKFSVMGFVNAIVDFAYKAKDAASGLGKTIKLGLNKAVTDMINTANDEMNATPTIRPILDLSSVASGVKTINGMLSMQPSVGVLANVRAVSSMMNSRQNGNSDVISAIKELGRGLNNRTGDTYQVNGVTYSEGSEVSNAVKAIVRAIRVEGRK